jgi:tetratricopeptide (TPR) repeat protein
MGEVWKARDTRLNRTVAIKVSPGNFSQRFEREAHAIAALNHAHICQIHDVGPDYLVLEYIDGKRLTGPLPVEETIRLAIQIASALEEAHSRGILHRDLKPANILVTANGTAKLLDFGLAKLTPERTALPTQAATDEMLTSPGQTMGTAAYMSPEQARGEELDARTDLWSFGAVLYEMATGVRPFRGDSSAVIFKAILDATPTPAVRLNPDVPAELERVIDKALEKDRKLRYQSAADMRADLERLKRNSESHKVPEVTRRVRWPRMAGVAAILLAAVGAAYLFFVRRHAPKLTNKDTIVLADFTNTTGDPVFDGTLRQGLSAQLEQSPFLSLISDDRIAQTLALMTQPKDARLTKELSREVCQRTASAATIEGSIASLGSQYVLGLNAVNCHNGDLLAQEQVTANGKEQVLKALGEAATKLRRILGESLASVEKYDAPPQNVTTSSLEALQAYGLGSRTSYVKGVFAAIPFFERAITLDPNFATAYAWLGSAYFNLGEPTRSAETTRKAYGLRERTSEEEKFYISSLYELLVTGNLEAARRAYELWTQTYPRDGRIGVNLANTYFRLGEYDRALTAAQEALRLNPGSGSAYATLLYAYLLLDRLDAARATARQAQSYNLGGPFIHHMLYLVDFLQHDGAGMEREAAGLMGKPGYEDVILYQESDAAACGGDFSKARELRRRAVDSALRADEKETAGEYYAQAAIREALVGNGGLAKQEAQAALALANGQYVKAFSALALALAGDSGQAVGLARDLGKRFPEDTVVQFEYLPMIQAAVSLRSGEAGKAVQAVATAAPYESGSVVQLHPAYLRGEAYLATKQGAEAEAEFQKILDHPGVVLNDPIGALAHLGLGRAYALAGDTTKAKTAYQDFFALWKNADPDIPILQQAKAEYAKLK